MKTLSIAFSCFHLPVFYVGWVGLGATFESKLGTFDDAIDL